jgi:hypothetical protein
VQVTVWRVRTTVPVPGATFVAEVTRPPDRVRAIHPCPHDLLVRLRLSRVAQPGVAHHVTLRGNNRRQVLFTDADRGFSLALVRGRAGLFAWPSGRGA